jgi:phage terminase large subunit-like protein
MTENAAVLWTERNWVVPETGKLIKLREWQKVALQAMFPADGKLRWETFLISTVKKAGKTELDAIATM